MKKPQQIIAEFPSGFVISLLRKLVHEYDLKSYRYSGDKMREETSIYMPYLLAFALRDDIANETYNHTWLYQNDLKFMGYKIVDGYEYKIVIAHRDWWKNEEALRHEIEIIHNFTVTTK